MIAPVIDIHPHVIARDTARYPRAPLGGEASPWSRSRPVSAEEMIAAMDSAGIARSVLVQASTCYGHDNSYVADSVAKFPARFSGVFSVDPLAADAPQRIREWAGRGLTGLRIFTAGHTRPDQPGWLDDPRTFPAWECAGELSLPVCVQMRAGGIAQLATLLERFPKIRVVLDHMGRPALEDGPPYAGAAGLLALARHANLYLKFTIHNVRDARRGKATPESFLERAIAAFGAGRIAWGSNFPALEGSLAEIKAECEEVLASRPAAEREWIFGGTALALYPSLA
jgi:L-fuconolactonase